MSGSSGPSDRAQNWCTRPTARGTSLPRPSQAPDADLLASLHPPHSRANMRKGGSLLVLGNYEIVPPVQAAAELRDPT